MADPHTNFGYSTVATAPSPASSGTSLVVQAGDGAKFPSSGSFNATVWPASTQPTTANSEIVRVTAVSTDTFTITRAQESSSARTIVVGDQIADTITAKTLTDVELNVYVTDQNKTIPTTTQVIFDDYLELAASFFYELSTDAILTIGDFATPLPAPDLNTNIFVTVANETVPSYSEIVFSDFYELSAPFATEIATNGEVQVGASPDIVGPFLPGYEIGYSQITANVNIVSTVEATGTVIISAPPLVFDGGPVIAHFFSGAVVWDVTAGGDETQFSLFEGTTQITRLLDHFAPSTVASRDSAVGFYRFSPSAGVHVYTVTARVSSAAGTPTVGAGSGGTGGFPPAFLRFTKV